jgi:chemotaxis protein methyltransferase WspC
MAIERIEELLRRTMGLHADSIGSSTIERAVRGRLRALGLETIEDYWAQLQRSLDEVQELIEAVVVPETWFFRDPQAFSAMTRVLLQQAAARPTAEFRLLSLPCSTGEEPYTMAMALIDAGVPAERFRIDAIDISARSLAGATSSLRSEAIASARRYAVRSASPAPICSTPIFLRPPRATTSSSVATCSSTSTSIRRAAPSACSSACLRQKGCCSSAPPKLG